MKTLTGTLLLSFLLTFSLQAQREETLLGNLDMSGIWGGITYNYSSYESDWHLVRGGYGGLEFGRNVFLGYGGWNLKENVRTDRGSEFDLRYGGFMLGITPLSYRAIHPRINFLVGPGRVKFEGDDERILVFQPSAGAEFNLFQWFRLGLEGGYRLVANNGLDNLTNEDVSAPFIQVDLRFGLSWGN